MAYRWPTDPKGKPASHQISWDIHQRNLKSGAKSPDGGIRIADPSGGWTPVSQWDFGYGAGVTAPPAPPGTDSAAPAAPAEPYTAPLPVDPLHDAKIAALAKTRDDTLTGLTGERTRGLAEYGFTEDPTTQALAFDPNNPFSKAALLKKSYDTGRAKAAQSMAAGGQLYSGAFQNQQDLINRTQLGSEDTLQKSLIGFLAGNTGRRAQAQTDFETGVIAADSDQVERALDNPTYSPLIDTPAPAAPATGGVGAAATTTKPKAAPKKIPALKGNVLSAGANVRSTRGATATTKRKGNKRTYTTSVKGP